MKHTHTMLSQPGRETLYYQSWWPSGTLRGIILIAHGAAEHGGRYAHFAARVALAGLAVATVDLPGHGQSSGKRCCVDSFDTYLDAVALAKAQALAEYASHGDINSTSMPVILLGHSMGGLVASLYIHQDPDLVGAVFSGAALAVEPEPTAVQLSVLRILARWFPALGLLKLDAVSISRDVEVVDQYLQDPQVFTGKLSASLLSAMFSAMKRSADLRPRVTLPVLILHGEVDALVPPKASRMFYDGIASEDKTLRVLPGLFHEIFNEPEGDEIIDQVIQWVEQQLPSVRDV